MSHFTPKNIPGRLRWQCRRSCLEIDLLLNTFLEHPQGYLALSVVEQTHFQVLLDQDDDNLLQWLMGHAICDDQRLQQLVERIVRLSGIFT